MAAHGGGKAAHNSKTTFRQRGFILGAGRPKIIAAEGSNTVRRFVEFFTANIRNKNTRAAYAQAVGQFCRWCERRRFSLDLIEPVTVAAYVEELGKIRSKPTVKQHLAAAPCRRHPCRNRPPSSELCEWPSPRCKARQNAGAFPPMTPGNS